MTVSDRIRYYTKAAVTPVRSISPQEALDRGMFGPLYHGTNHDINEIIKTGFNSKYSVPTGGVRGLDGRPIGTSNGYSMSSFGYSVAPPIHHLGFGSYFTTVKAIAIRFNGGTSKGLKSFYLDSNKVDGINFGAERTMMKWWVANGYDMTSDATRSRDSAAWIKATGNLTRNLRSKYDAVWFKGKGIRSLLDGDQVCVYNQSLLYVVDPTLASGLEIGSKVTHTGWVAPTYLHSNTFYVDDLQPSDYGSAGNLAGSGWRGVFRAVDHDGRDRPREGNFPMHFIPPKSMVGVIVSKSEVPSEWKDRRGDYYYGVKWAKGGTMYNYGADELKPVKG